MTDVSDEPVVQAAAPRRGNALMRVYRGQTSFDFVGRKRIWFTVSALIIVVGLISLGARGLNLGIDFKGGSSWTVIAPGVSQQQATDAVIAAGLPQPTVFILGGKTITVEDNINALPPQKQTQLSNEVVNALAKLANVSPNQVSTSTVGPTWGGQVTKRALIALLAFFVAVVLYISARFEPKMALAAFIAMVHDLLITVGVYSIFGFQITPDTVIAILTILGYSLYDTVVVFDRVRDNTKGILNAGSLSYSDMVNLSMNQTLARSINTSLVAILPVLSVLVVGAYILGATTLQTYGVALFVGLVSGAYSSIFIASPLLAILKEREPRMRELSVRVAARKDRQTLTPAAVAAMSSDGTASAPRPPRSPSAVGVATTVRGAPTEVVPRARKRKRR
jgi:preprotein translocase subunit SecF